MRLCIALNDFSVAVRLLAVTAFSLGGQEGPYTQVH